MKQEHVIALRQARSDIVTALERLERATSRAVEDMRIVEVDGMDGETLRAVEIKLSPEPEDNWSAS